ncbi:uncharacterized protein LOC124911982 [Impatiens glandulifera]|uniref:uncharacterized protein LOC124911982 n=1 Tax=Impatiens glandulifera TaxID=253017 RepID=UPI001FB0C3AD|nr:uncharacterized protein LOC124911982 [Impatiens glandulifera]
MRAETTMKRELAFALQVQSQFDSPLGRTRGTPVENGSERAKGTRRSNRLNGSSENRRKKPKRVSMTPSREKSGNVRYNKEVLALSNGAADYGKNKRSKVANEEDMVSGVESIETANQDQIESGSMETTTQEVMECTTVLPPSGDEIRGVYVEASAGEGLRDSTEQPRSHQGILDDIFGDEIIGVSGEEGSATEDLLDTTEQSIFHQGISEDIVGNEIKDVPAEGLVEEGLRDGTELHQEISEDISGEEIKGPSAEATAGEGLQCLMNGEKVEAQNADAQNVVVVKAPKRFTRSALKQKVEQLDVGLVSVPIAIDYALDGAVDGVIKVNRKEDVALGEGLLTKIESKMPTMQGNYWTLKKFLATGLLDGYKVFYYSSIEEHVLHGVIKDGGISCLCGLCQGSTVISPCQFEIHACNKSRNPQQYIRLDSGMSLHNVLLACQNTSVEVLIDTIQTIIGDQSVKKSTLCMICKGSCIPVSSDQEKQCCDSCADVKNLEITATPINTPNARPSTKKRGRPKSSTPASSCKSSAYKVKKKIMKKSQKGSIKSSSRIICVSPPVAKSLGKITKKDLGMHKVVFGEGGLPNGTEVAYFSRGQKLLEGYTIGHGIFCRCCSSEISASQFEAHAGWSTRRKPYQNIYTSNGVSLHEFAISILQNGRNKEEEDNDSLCIFCADDGNLLFCDGCPRAFHMECASLSSVPTGKWFCNYCQNMFQREKYVGHNANAVAAGRVAGDDPIDQITKRCIRIVKTEEEAESVACLLCRGYDFSKTGFGPRTVIVCDQCEKEYHIGCLKEHEMDDLKELPEGKWFCSIDCDRVHSILQNFASHGEKNIPDSLLDIMKKKHENESPDGFTNFDVRWRILSGKVSSSETKSLLSKIVTIFHHSFDPIVDEATGRDFIPSMVYGRSFRGQDFGGMYCALLTVNSTIVSVGIFRVFGQEIAELPLVATSNAHQGKGYFKVLFSCIENLLSSLNVKKLVLPAAAEAMSIWTEKFHFDKIPPHQLAEYREKCWPMLTFKGTSMLHKSVPSHGQTAENDDLTSG